MIIPLRQLVIGASCVSSCRPILANTARYASTDDDASQSFYAASPLVGLSPLAHLLMTEALSAISTAAATTTAPRLLVIDATAGNGSDSAHLASLVCAAPYPLDLLCIGGLRNKLDRKRVRSLAPP